ncbi:hypothetical protein AUJ66_08720 [Candidatus Desantisbacteria bacterium CG1_02_38_46]|uniref:Uncharacterized protein n=3 Tax=unclassified Candidatus Desantisiibacteriota TaxID=3106372 RepID=A0A2M7SFG4_9BACT|nr:MAG: hypothetical protein AUJ66_08720 [Candidatus Desantisbacteria bacterium CG1_02_38_46]PIU51018.1 MAG: hypothetical protein COS91_06460 [Candidatus Desantisbacteria bacterium CG07_land_8_20_14_0_80_39_15]PIZ18240.1 MAG: hypothetical protein COY52_00475 [Candidatus Desantisbacteria bacterium CG_4_10_14_0_8_um_filter_48_22]
MRNLNRLVVEIRKLISMFGRDNIEFDEEDGLWVKILNYSLRNSKVRYNLFYITIFIHIPEHYDDEQPVVCMVDLDLKMNKGHGWEGLPHTHDKPEWAKLGYQWVCFEPDGLGKSMGLVSFVETIKLYLTNPVKYVDICSRY